MGDVPASGVDGGPLAVGAGRLVVSVYEVCRGAGPGLAS